MNTSERHLILDASNTTITFAVMWFGIWPVRGVFRRLHGVLELGSERIEQSGVRLDVEAGSIETGIPLRDRHLRGARFLHADLHPFISFKSTAVQKTRGQLGVHGILSLRGIESAVSSLCPLDDMGNGAESLRLCGSIPVSRHQHRVGISAGLAGLNPMLFAIANVVRITVHIRVPVARLRPLLQSADVHVAPPSP